MVGAGAADFVAAAHEAFLGETETGDQADGGRVCWHDIGLDAVETEGMKDFWD